VGLGLRHAVQVDEAGASHFGGTAQGMAISWPGHIGDPGGIRRQFHHVIDIVPTILEATGIPAAQT
jgi:arylsulfatase A-like enzyme